MPLSQPEQLRQFFDRLGQRHPQPAALYLFGGSAVLWLGGPRPTLDIDFTLTRGDPALRQNIAAVAAELGLDLEESAPAEFMPLPAGHEKRHRFLGQFGSVAVYLFDPYSIAVMKIDRAFDSDMEDVRFLLAAGEIDLAALAQLIDDVAGRYDEPIKLRRNFAELQKALGS
ncbi:MAG: hypothetical protein KA764_10600 [Anaerolineales bacterium]|nr:hypothetical protein [Anaerolineales bacterium]